MKCLWSLIAAGIMLSSFGSNEARAVAQAPGSDVATSTTAAESRGWFPGLQTSFGYMIYSDLAELESPRLVTHNISNTLGYDLGKGFALVSSLDLSVQSQGSNVIADAGSSPFSLAWMVGAAKEFELGNALAASHSLELTGAYVLPVSDEYRYEGYKGIPLASARVSSRYLDGLFRNTNTVTYSYTLNTFEFSPTSKKVNAKDKVSYSTSLSVPIYKGLGLRGALGVAFQRRLDGSVEYRSNNSVGLTYAKGMFYLAASFENGSFSGDQDLNLLFVDKYRRLVSATAAISF